MHRDRMFILGGSHRALPHTNNRAHRVASVCQRHAARCAPVPYRSRRTCHPRSMPPPARIGDQRSSRRASLGPKGTDGREKIVLGRQYSLIDSDATGSSSRVRPSCSREGPGRVQWSAQSPRSSAGSTSAKINRSAGPFRYVRWIGWFIEAPN